MDSVTSSGESFLKEDEALRNLLIVERLLSFLPLESLKTIRQVSSFFNSQATKEMFKTYYLNLSSSVRQSLAPQQPSSSSPQEEDVLLEFLTKMTADHVKFRKIKIYTIAYDDSRVDVLPHIHIYGHHVREVFYNLDYYPRMEEFCPKLRHLPNLKVLELFYLHLTPSDPLWTPFYGILGQLDKLVIERLSREALQYFIKLKKDAPACVQKCFPGLGNWSAEVGGGTVPRGSLVGGRDDEIGHDLIVARSQHPRGDLLPGKLVAAHGVCYAPWACQAHSLRKYETLIIKEDEVEWVRATGDEVVRGAIVGGMTEYGEILYVGRALHAGSIHLGKVHRSHRVLYIAYNGDEIAHPDYETLVLKSAAVTN